MESLSKSFHQNIRVVRLNSKAKYLLGLLLIPILYIGYHLWIPIRSASTESLSTPSPSQVSGFLPIHEVESICSSYNLSIYPDRTRRKIYDLFLIDTELDLLEVRLHELQHEVDYFVIIESTHTFTKNPKPMNFRDNYKRFEAFLPKIIYRAINFDHITDDDPWKCELYARNSLFDTIFPSLLGPSAPEQGDVIIVSDADEIPRPSTLVTLRNCQFPERTTLRTVFTRYSFQWLWTANGDLGWQHPQATYYQGNNTVKPEDLRRNLDNAWDMRNAGWHCSWCFPTVADVIHKIESFSETVVNQPYNKHPEVIVDRIRQGAGIFRLDPENLTRLDSNEDIPEYIKENRQKFEYMLDRDPENANFKDWS